MTLIISAATKKFALQVADTKLTKPDGSFYDDGLVKTTILHCQDAKLAISYTGLALIDRKRTDKWLVAQLSEAKASEKVFMEVLELLRNALTGAIARNPALEKYGLSLAIVGLGYSPQGIRQPAIAVVTNCEESPERGAFKDIEPKGREFSQYVMDPDCPTYISVHGAVASRLVIGALRRRIQKGLRKAKTHADSIELLHWLVTMLRLQRQNPKVGHLIGDDCTAVIIKGDFCSSSFFYTRHKKIKRYPNIVRKEFTVEDLQSEPSAV